MNILKGGVDFLWALCLSPLVAFPLSLTNSLALRPLLGRRILSPPIRGGHASFPRHRDRSFFTPGECSAVFFLLHPTTEKPSSSWSGVLVGNLAASPSIPRGMSPHGARWLWVPIDGVGSCGEVALSRA